MVEKFILNPTYKKENGLWSLNIDSLKLPDSFTVRERSLVYIPAGEFGGNHKHPRYEVLIGLAGNLHIIWEDENERCEEAMITENALCMFIIHGLTPHAVMNRGDTPAVLLELTDGMQHGVEKANLL